MPVRVHLADALTITATPLTAAAFRNFGDVIENPGPDVHPHTLSLSSGSGREKFPFNAVSANQGSAIKYQHVTVPLDLYGQAPSEQPGRQVVNMFVCAARELEPESISDLFPAGNGTAYPAAAKPAGLFRVRILERHPFTTQTFIPLDADFSRRYLVVVAPSLAPSGPDLNLPVPTINSNETSNWHVPGSGLPDLRGLRAFIATGRQAVTCEVHVP
jgi:ureidoglycolate lyase